MTMTELESDSDSYMDSDDEVQWMSDSESDKFD